MINITKRMIRLAKKDPKNLEGLMIKLTEETGELAEAVNFKLGNLPHKTMKEPLEGEVADVINCAISVMVRAYPNESESDLLDRLLRQLIIKANKWEFVINKGSDPYNSMAFDPSAHSNINTEQVGGNQCFTQNHTTKDGQQTSTTHT